MGKGKRRREKKRKGSSSHSALAEHQRTGKTLVPPLMAIPDLHMVSWLDARLPEMLWAALIVAALPRDKALEVFRAVVDFVHAQPNGHKPHVTHSSIAALPQEIRGRLIEAICREPKVRTALAPLSLLEGLPARQEWLTAVGEFHPDEGWESLRLAVATCFDHQSQEATDCRWLRVVVAIAAGRLIYPVGDSLREILAYPSFGDQRKVRPTVRAAEGTLTELLGSESTGWPERFWEEAFAKTTCVPMDSPDTALPEPATTRARLQEVTEHVRSHFVACTTASRRDARMDATFGLCLYVLRVLDELLVLGLSASVLGRLGLRTILEAVLTLRYLCWKNDPAVWQRYREYGSGQAKLAFLKGAAGERVGPTFVDSATLESLANEDRWLEFNNIDLGHWEGANLRKIATDCGEKALYNAFYDWTSAFVHANWAAVRNSTMVYCANALHRLHRLPSPHWLSLGDVVPDATRLADALLDIVAFEYPGLAPLRLAVE